MNVLFVDGNPKELALMKFMEAEKKGNSA